MSHDETIQPSRNVRQAADVVSTPDPEAVPAFARVIES
jgi:hypothetical protein